jgi:hypothetical protein
MPVDPIRPRSRSASSSAAVSLGLRQTWRPYIWIATWFEFMVFAMYAPMHSLPWLAETVLAVVWLGVLSAGVGALTLTLAHNT